MTNNCEKNTPLVDFLYLGPPKSASTWLFKMLNNQPSIYLPSAKDIYFFDRYYERGVEWYENLFTSSSEGQCVGEICHDYIYGKNTPERIFRYNPKMKFIAILRNPIERSISHYKYSLKVGNIKGSFLEGINKNPSIIECGYLSDLFIEYFNFFDKELFLIIDFNEIKSQPHDVLNRIGIFLDIVVEDTQNVETIINPARISRFSALTKYLRGIGLWVRKLGFPNIVGFFKSSILMSILFKKVDDVSVKITENDKVFLNEKYESEIQKLKKLFPEELKKW